MSISNVSNVNSFSSSTHKKNFNSELAILVGKVARAVIVGMIAVIGNAVTLGIPLACKVVSDWGKKERKKEIETREIEHLYTALTIGLSGEEKWCINSSKNSLQWDDHSLCKEIESKGIAKEDALYFAKKVLKLRNAVYELKAGLIKGEKVEVGSVEKVFEKYQKYARSERFMRIFSILESEDCKVINFLKALAVKFQSTNIEEILIQNAKEELGPVEKDLPDGYSIGKIGEAMLAHQDEIRFRRDRWYQKLIWAITNPVAFYHSWESLVLPDVYNSRDTNPFHAVHSIEINDAQGNKHLARLIAGPSPFNDPVFKKIFLKDAYELRFDIMDTNKKHEYSMIRNLEAIAQESNGHLEHVLFGFQIKKDRGYLNHDRIEPLIDGYEKILLDSRSLRKYKSDHGVVIKKNHLSDEQIRAACEETKILMQELNPDLSDLGVRHAVLVAVDAMIALGIIQNYFKNHKEILTNPNIDPDLKSVYITAACKQCYDRGPVYLSAMMLFLRSLNSSEPLSDSEFYRIAGLSLFRAPLNEGREQQSQKAKVFFSLTQMLGARLDLLSKHTRRFVNRID